MRNDGKDLELFHRQAHRSKSSIDAVNRLVAGALERVLGLLQNYLLLTLYPLRVILVSFLNLLTSQKLQVKLCRENLVNIYIRSRNSDRSYNSQKGSAIEIDTFIEKKVLYQLKTYYSHQEMTQLPERAWSLLCTVRMIEIAHFHHNT